LSNLSQKAKLTRVPLAERVSTSRHRKAAAIAWPRLVDRRLDELVEVAIGDGEKTNRAELAAAIVSAWRGDSGRLTKILRDYRRADGKEVLLHPPKDAPSVELKSHRSGPRKAAD
jgi:hypothetical protein